MSEQQKGTILYIPGISGLKDMDRIQQIGALAQEAGFGFEYLATWKDREELDTKTLSEIHTSIESKLSELKRGGEVYVIAKSLGGGITLLRSWPQISKMVLWAPAVGLEEVSSFNRIKDTKMGDLKSTFEITTDASTLKSITTPALVIRGTADTAVPLSPLKEIVNLLPRGQCMEIEGLEHSAKTELELKNLMQLSLQFFEA